MSHRLSKSLHWEQWLRMYVLGSNCFYKEFENIVLIFLLSSNSGKSEISVSFEYLYGVVIFSTGALRIWPQLVSHIARTFCPCCMLLDQTGFVKLSSFSTTGVYFAICHDYWFLSIFKHTLFLEPFRFHTAGSFSCLSYLYPVEFPYLQ